MNKDVQDYILDPLLFWLWEKYGGDPFPDSSAVNGYGAWIECLDASVVDGALRKAEQSGFLHGVHDKFADTYYSLTEAGMKFVGERRDNPDCVLGKQRRFGNGWLHSALEKIVNSYGIEEILDASSGRRLGDVVDLPLYGRIGGNDVVRDLVPASDRTVTINHNQPDYAHTVVALNRVIEEFRNDHRLDNELGHEKGALLQALEGGRQLLDDTVLNVRIGTALILEPLRRLVEKYDQALVGALASKAIELVAKLFGLGN